MQADCTERAPGLQQRWLPLGLGAIRARTEQLRAAYSSERVAAAEASSSSGLTTPLTLTAWR